MDHFTRTEVVIQGKPQIKRLCTELNTMFAGVANVVSNANAYTVTTLTGKGKTDLKDIAVDINTNLSAINTAVGVTTGVITLRGKTDIEDAVEDLNTILEAVYDHYEGEYSSSSSSSSQSSESSESDGNVSSSSSSSSA